jgi:hypothetical protein
MKLQNVKGKWHEVTYKFEQSVDGWDNDITITRIYIDGESQLAFPYRATVGEVKRAAMRYIDGRHHSSHYNTPA